APIPIPSQAAPGLPPSFDAWFQRALEREPERRFSSVAELAEALGAAAGMAPRSQVASSHGHNVGQMPTAAMHHGVATPQGLGPQRVHTPPPQATPFSGAGSAYNARSATPNPAGMTNAPFTSSQPVPGVSGGKGMLIAGIIGVLAVAVGVVFAVKFGMTPKDDAATDGARLTPPAAASVAEPEPAEDKPSEPTEPSTQGANTIAVSAEPPPEAPPEKPEKPAKAAPPQKLTPAKIAPSKPTTPPKTTPTPTQTVATTP